MNWLKLNFDIIKENHYHHATLSTQFQDNNIAAMIKQKKFFSNCELHSQQSSMIEIASALNLILEQTYDIFHSEWKNLDCFLQQLLIENILSHNIDVSAYMKCF